eukprot:967995-Prorocentrum_minimum.AAC.4
MFIQCFVLTRAIPGLRAALGSIRKLVSRPSEMKAAPPSALRDRRDDLPAALFNQLYPTYGDDARNLDDIQIGMRRMSDIEVRAT